MFPCGKFSLPPELISSLWLHLNAADAFQPGILFPLQRDLGVFQDSKILVDDKDSYVPSGTLFEWRFECFTFNMLSVIIPCSRENKRQGYGLVCYFYYSPAIVLILFSKCESQLAL